MLAANAGYEAYRARGVMKDGRRFGRPPDPFVAPALPEGLVNITDPDSRNLEVPTRLQAGLQRPSGGQREPDAGDRGGDQHRLAGLRAPGADDYRRARAAAQDRDPPQARGGARRCRLRHQEQMDQLAAQGIPLLIPPDAGQAQTARPGWQGGRYCWWTRYLLATENGHQLYRNDSRQSSPCSGRPCSTANSPGFTDAATAPCTVSGD